MRRSVVMRMLLCFILLSLNVSSYAAKDSKKAKKISIAWDSYPRSFDPRYASDANSQYLEELLHCSLFAFDPAGGLVPSLAESWRWLDSKRLEVKVKKGHHFADGTAVTVEDVKANFDFYKSKAKPPSPRAGAFRLLEKVELKGQTLVFVLSEADVSFMPNLSIGLLTKKLASGPMLGRDNQVKGCGPYVLSKTGVSAVELSKNSAYTLGAKARSDLLIKIVKDESTRFAKLINGELDLVQNALGRDKIEHLPTKYKSLKMLKTAGLRTSYVGFNFKDKLIQRVEVRQAIAAAINKDAIIKYILRGLAQKANTLLPPTSSFYSDKVAASVYDPKAAAALLDKAGFKINPDTGYRFKLSYKTTQDESRIAIGKAISGDLRKIGIKLEVQSLEWGRFKSDVEKGHVQLWGLSWVGFKDPDIYRYAFATESWPPAGGNRGRFSDPSLDILLSKALTLTNEEERRKSYAEIQSLVAQSKPYIFLFHEENFAVFHKSVKGFEVYADGRYSALAKVYRE